MIPLPKSPNQYTAPMWSQDNNSDVNGSLYASFNLDLTENEGKLRLGKRLVLNTGTADVAEITSYPAGFKVFSSISITGKATIAGLSGTGYVFWVNSNYPSGTSFAKITATNSPATVDSTVSDIEVFHNALYVSTASNSVYTTTDGNLTNTWGATFTAGTPDSTGVHMFCVFQNRMYMTRIGNNIISWDAGNTVATTGTYTVSIGTDNLRNLITFIKAGSNRIWIGTIDILGGKGAIYEWDGTATQPTKAYLLDTEGVLSCVIKDDIPYVMDVRGNLLAWNGGVFTKLSVLNRVHNKLLFNALSTVNNRFIHPNGMSIVKGKINILIDGRNYDNTTVLNDSIEETIPSGIWEYDENKGLYHKHSIATAHVGDTITDYGQYKLFGVGALNELNLPNNASGRNGTFLAGASYYTDTTTTKSGIFYDDSNDTLQKGGYLVTVKLYATDTRGFPSVQNAWQNIYTLYRSFLNTNDEITVKYRVLEADPLIVTGTWTSTTTFTTTTDVSACLLYEVEPILGLGSGKTSHITSIVNNSGTYTVTVDETYTGATSTSQIRIQNWKKISTINTTSPATYDQAGIGPVSNWVQFKIGMIFTGRDEIEKLLIINQDYNPAN